MDQESLPLLIQHKIQERRLPHDDQKVWSSPSDGEMCDVCDAVLTRDELLMQGSRWISAGGPLSSTSYVSRSGITNGAPPNGRGSHPRSHPGEPPRWPTAPWQRSESVRTSRELAKMPGLRGSDAESPAHDGGLPADDRPKGCSLPQRRLHPR